MRPSIKVVFSYIICFCTSVSLVAQTTSTPQTPQKSKKKSEEVAENKEEQTHDIQEDIILENDDLDQGTDEDLEVEQNTDDKSAPPTLYDPKMNYGTGAPPMKKPRVSSKMRSIYAFIASVVLATAGGIIGAKNSGRDAPSSSSH